MPILLGAATEGLSSLRESETVLLLLLLASVLFGSGLFVGAMYMVMRYNQKDRLPARRLPRDRGDREAGRDQRAALAAVGVPSRWLAIRSTSPLGVQMALGLQQTCPCSWEEGLTVAQDQKLFISPPLGGWILVMGPSLPEPGDDIDRTFRFLMDLSRKLGHVQFFSLNRAVNHHAWAQLEDGMVRRAYAWAGRTLWNQGRMTRPEIELGLKCHGYGDGEERVEFDRVDPAALTTERLPLLAARWSLDPGTIDPRRLKEHRGITGDISGSGAR
ncbi:MAG: hypothetical protein RJA22_2908 [Verrucomicrobiota bacterium]